MAEVANAGKQDETDRKIAAFNKAKEEFTRRQDVRDIKRRESATIGNNPFAAPSGDGATEPVEVRCSF
jgi:hypothetical protein